MKSLIVAALAAALALTASTAYAKLHASDVDYTLDDTVLQGYIAYDDSFTGKRPGVLVIHEWTGLGPYVKTRCEQLAKLGYVAFGADIYGKGVRPANHEEAAKVSGSYAKDRPLMRARIMAGLEQLKGNPRVDVKRIAAIGYCFGGMAVLELARSGADVSGVVGFHGVLGNPDPDNAKDIRTKVLVQQGADDSYAAAAQLEAFIDEMRASGADWRLVLYGGTVHSFTVPAAGDDPSSGAAYNKLSDERSWRAMLDFFDEIFR